MEVAIEAFQSIRNNLLKQHHEENDSEFVSEFSQDYNSTCDSDVNRKGILKARSKYVEDNLVIPAEILDKICKKDGHNYRRARDSGFNSELNSSVLVSEQGSEAFCGDQGSVVYNSEQGSNVFGSEQPSEGPSEPPSAAFGSELASNYLENYGLNGPLDEYLPPPSPLPSPSLHRLRLPVVDAPAASVTSINTAKKKRQQEAKQATIRQHYYPEGGWGWVILLCSLTVQALSHGIQLSFGVLLLAIIRRWGSDNTNAACWIGSLSLCTSFLFSPVTVATCRMKSTRLTAVVGGLITSLGLLFTSFASQFHQMAISYGFILGIGVGFVRDSSTLMVAQYFKRKRELVEVVVVSGSGMGIIIISIFMRSAIKEVGWRIGLQAITGVCTVCSILGMFYRSATLYHPQRRAILHLKSQKRKIKDKNKALEEKLPFFDFSSLSSRTFQIILVSTGLTSLGIFTPIILLIYQVEEEKFSQATISQVQTHLGLAWIVGVVFFGALTLNSSRECHIGRQYLCQFSLLTSSAAVLSYAKLEGETGFLAFLWMFGISTGGYHYTLKMFVFEKVRARNFARAWGFLQASQALPILFGIPITLYINQGCDDRSGFYFSGACMLSGFFCMFLIDVHKHRLRKRRHSKHMKRHGASVKSTSTKASDDSFVSPGQNPLARRLSFDGEEEEEDFDVLPAMAILANQQFIQGIIEHEQNEELSCMSEGIVEMDQDRMLLGDMCLDNITSCDVVDNYLMLDEYEQNLIKEHEGPASLQKRIRKWSLVKQQCVVNGPDGPTVPRDGSTGLRVLDPRTRLSPFKPHAITTIHEDSLEPP